MHSSCMYPQMGGVFLILIILGVHFVHHCSAVTTPLRWLRSHEQPTASKISESFLTVSLVSDSTEGGGASSPSFFSRVLILVKLRTHSISPKSLLSVINELLEDGGDMSEAVLEGYVPPDGLLLSIKKSALLDMMQFVISSHAEISLAVPYSASYKHTSGKRSHDPTSGFGETSFDVLVASHVSAKQLIQLLHTGGSFPPDISKVFALTERVIRIQCNIFNSSFARNCFDAVHSIFADLHEVLWIEPSRSPPVTHARSDATLLWQNPTTEMPAETFPLKGEGEVVSVADTGLDIAHCSFYDPVVQVVPRQRNDAHRKVVYFLPLADSDDIVGGHGSHVASIAVGKCLNRSYDQFDGIASEAKLAFVDIGFSNASDTINPPSDLAKQMYQVLYDVGIRLHSDSWGSTPQAQPTIETFNIDDFLHSHPDFLLIRSAGNDGDHFASVSTEATSKNIVAVASAMNYHETFLETASYRDFDLELQPLLGRMCHLNDTYCGISKLNQSICCGTDLLAKYCCMDNISATFATSPALYDASDLSDFSSKGPTNDMRIKPDVTGVGEWIIGAKSDPSGIAVPGHESFLSLRGTSMAAPGIAGAAAIVREYFVKGYYPSGAPVTSDSMLPSAALQKAMLVAAARPLKGYSNIWSQITALPYPSPYGSATWVDGFGKVALRNVLPFANDSSVPWFSLHISEGSVVQGENHTVCFRATQDAGNLTIVLVWTDPPALPVALQQLVNDLDLLVRDANATYFGNSPIDQVEPFDRVNNVERVDIAVQSGDSITIQVLSHRVLTGSQNYSFVVVGPPGLELLSGRNLTSNQCRDCAPGTTIACPIEHGVGEKKCLSSGHFGKCFPTSCSRGYSLSSWNSKCRRFADFYLIIGISTGVSVLLAALTCLPICICFRRRTVMRDPIGFWEVYAVVHPKIGWVVFGTLLTLLAAAASLFQPIFLGQLIERLPTSLRFSQVRSLFYYIIALNVAEFVLGLLGEFVLAWVAEVLVLSIRCRLLYNTLQQKFSVLDLLDKGELNTCVFNDPTYVVHYPVNVLQNFYSSLVKTVVGFLMMMIISWQLSVLFFAIVPVLIIIGWLYGRSIQPLNETLLAHLGTMGTVLYDVLINVRLVKLYRREIDEYTRFHHAAHTYYRTSIRVLLLNTVQSSGKNFFVQAIVVALLWYGSILVIKPSITTGLLLAYFLYLSMASTGVTTLVDLYPSYKSTLGSLARLYRLCDLVAVRSSAEAKHQIKKRGPGKTYSVEFKTWVSSDAKPVEVGLENVSFSYDDNNAEAKPILNNVSLRIRAGELLGVVGPSGCGKSTLLNLIAGLLEPSKGKLRYEGSPDEPPRQSIAVVEQQPKMLHRTLRENVKYGNSSASDAQIQEVLAQLSLAEMVSRLPEGLDTVVGETSAHQLSGGQKQRIAIARALLAHPSLLLLDEPTSELDPESRALVLKVLERLRGNCTVVFITHDATAAKIANRVITLDGSGRIEEDSSPQELRFNDRKEKWSGGTLRSNVGDSSASGGSPLHSVTNTLTLAPHRETSAVAAPIPPVNAGLLTQKLRARNVSVFQHDTPASDNLLRALYQQDRPAVPISLDTPLHSETDVHPKITDD